MTEARVNSTFSLRQGMRSESEELEDLPEWVKLVNKYANENKENKKRIKSKFIYFQDDELSIENLVLNRLKKLHHPLLPDQIIRFPLVFSKICAILCLTKGQAWSILKRLEKAGCIEIVPYQGIRIKQTQSSKSESL